MRERDRANARVELFRDFSPDRRMLSVRDEFITQRAFLARATELCLQLPASRNILNLCLQRRTFMHVFCATLLRGATNVLISDPSPASVQRLLSMHDIKVVSDDPTRGDSDQLVQWQGEPGARSLPNPLLHGSMVAALPFTSGSTGTPLAHPKRLDAMLHTADATEARLFAGWEQYSVLATVPSQHMYGLETTLMLALCGRATVACEQPLLPADIASALLRLPRPRVLVTSPVHLRALLRGVRSLPEADLVVSATAPLSNELAAEAERRLRSPVMEIYGCTEIGSLATRRTLETDVWETLGAFELEANGELAVQVIAPGLSQPVPLPDRIELIDQRRFHLRGRQDDVVNVGGKRASLSQLNHLLLQIDGVVDGLIFVPPEGTGEVARLSALLVLEGREIRGVLADFAAVTDPVFVPRPARQVDRIERNATGKMPLATLKRAAADRQDG